MTGRHRSATAPPAATQSDSRRSRRSRLADPTAPSGEAQRARAREADTATPATPATTILVAAPWAATVRTQVADWPPVAAAPADPAALARYATTGPWCAPYATWTRRAGAAYCVLVALPVALACHGLARMVAWMVRAHDTWTPGTAGPAEGRWHRWLAAHCRRPPSLAVLATRACEAGTNPAATTAAVAATAVAYAVAWVTARPGRLLASALLTVVVSVF